MRLEIVNGEQYTPQGVRVAMGVRCEHGVVDGDKPLTSEGPRCLTCRETWFPKYAKSEEGRQHDKYLCWDCGRKLHLIYTINKDTGDYEAKFWGHPSPSLECRHSTYAIRSRETRYGLFGEKNWLSYVDGLVWEYHDCLERAARRAGI